MNPDKIKQIGYAALGLWVVLAGGLGYLAYDASSARAEAESTLEQENDAFRRFNDAPVFPSKVSIAGVKTNETMYGAWYEAAFALAGRGDEELPAETPSVFKQRLQSAVRRLQGLPGEAGGKLSQPTFFFGFETFLGEADALPLPAEIPLLAEQLHFIEHFGEILAEAGVCEVKSLARVMPKPDGECAFHRDYTVTFTSRPAGLVRVLNSLAADHRFVAVDGFSFKEVGETITARISGEDEKNAASGRRGRGRGRRRAAADTESAKADGEGKKENRVVTDPAVNAVFEVTMTLKVYDFRKPPENPDDNKSKKKKRGAR